MSSRNDRHHSNYCISVESLGAVENFRLKYKKPTQLRRSGPRARNSFPVNRTKHLDRPYTRVLLHTKVLLSARRYVVCAMIIKYVFRINIAVFPLAPGANNFYNRRFFFFQEYEVSARSSKYSGSRNNGHNAWQFTTGHPRSDEGSRTHEQ